jgi:hypothetical protein
MILSVKLRIRALNLLANSSVMCIFSNGKFSNEPSRHPKHVSRARIRFGHGLVFIFALFLNLSGVISAMAVSQDEQVAAIKSQMYDAIFRVQDIVNQPVTQLQRTPDMLVTFYSPGWFHPGAIKPNFNTVDVRTTQTFVYDSSQYVTSDLNPGVVFLGKELEFNPMTKYFITDRLVPKKKLTETEMLEINRLYRIIGHCEQQLSELQNPDSPPTAETLLTTLHRLAFTHQHYDNGFVGVC